jgi:hypothetical protein
VTSSARPPSASVPEQQAPARDGALSSQILVDDEEIRIDHFRRSDALRTLVVTFDPIAYSWDRPPYGHEFLHKQELDVLAVRKKRENFYQPLSREAFEAAVTAVAVRYERVIAYGSSLGAYAALYFGRDQPWTVIASSPRNSSHPQYGNAYWQTRAEFRHERLSAETKSRCRAIILYDPRDLIDRRYLEGEVLPQFEQADVLRVPFTGHPSNHALSEMGFIAPFVRAVLAGEPKGAWPTLDRRAQRTKSSVYFHVLALHALEHGHVTWADALVARSLELRSSSMFALRVQGQVRLAQLDWPGAVQALERALAAGPADDPTTLALLDRARRGQTSAHAPAPSPCEPPPPVRTRVLRWLRRLAARYGR